VNVIGRVLAKQSWVEAHVQLLTRAGSGVFVPFLLAIVHSVQRFQNVRQFGTVLGAECGNGLQGDRVKRMAA
jgi:hypothetical protein